MFRKILLAAEKLRFSRQQLAQPQETKNLNERGAWIEDHPPFKTDEQDASTVLDEDSATEIVGTWSLLNPP